MTTPMTTPMTNTHDTIYIEKCHGCHGWSKSQFISGGATIACDAIVATPKQKFIRADGVSEHAKNRVSWVHSEGEKHGKR